MRVHKLEKCTRRKRVLSIEFPEVLNVNFICITNVFAGFIYEHSLVLLEYRPKVVSESSLGSEVAACAVE